MKDKVATDIVKIDTNDASQNIKSKYSLNEHSGKFPLMKQVTINLNLNFIMIMNLNKNFIPHAFLQKLQRYTNFLFWLLWTWLDNHIRIGSINLQKTLLFICMPKMNLIKFNKIQFFLEILLFKEIHNLICILAHD